MNPLDRIHEIRNTCTFDELVKYCESLGQNVDVLKESYKNGSKKQQFLDYNWLIGYSVKMEFLTNKKIK